MGALLATAEQIVKLSELGCNSSNLTGILHWFRTIKKWNGNVDIARNTNWLPDSRVIVQIVITHLPTNKISVFTQMSSLNEGWIACIDKLIEAIGCQK